MKKFLLSLIAATCLSVSAAPQFREGVILVAPKVGISDANFKKALKVHGASVKNKLKDINVYEISVPAKSEQKVQLALSKNKQIKFAELDQLVAEDYIQNDPLATYQATTVRAREAWDTSEGEGITIAISDSGVNANHQDMVGKVIVGYNFFANNYDTNDVTGHGTAVAGTAAAYTNNGLGIAGIAGKAKILAITIADPATKSASFSNMANGVTFAANNGAKVSNTSYGGAGNSSTIQSAAAYMRSKGGVVVFSAGNTNSDLGYLDAPNILAVAATDSADNRASFSSFGANVDLAAPGVNTACTLVGGNYGICSGTSFSSPITAGVVALVFAANPALTPAQVHDILESTAKDLGTIGKDPYFGYGRVDAYAAVQKALVTDTSDVTAPTVSIASPSNGATVKGVLSIDVSAADATGVTSTSVAVNGVSIGSDLLAPYTYAIDTTTYSNNTNLSIVATAKDLAGNVGASSTVNVKVLNPDPTDITAPTINVFGITGGGVYSGNINVSATAADMSPVMSSSIKLNGTTVASSASGSVTYRWNTRKYRGQTVTFTFTATDLSNNVATTSVIVQAK